MATLKGWRPSAHVSKDVVSSALQTIVPVWLHYVSQKIVEDAKNFASRFGSASRKFWYEVSTTSGVIDLFQSNIYCSGPYVETSAWDTEFRVPVGGFQYGDIDPKTGEPFPGGFNKYGSYITLVDKEVAAGESSIPSRSRVYTKFSGQVIKKEGFFHKAIRKDIGWGIMMSDIGRNNLSLLGLEVGKQIAINIGENIKAEGAAKGYIVTIDGPHIATIET